MGLSIAGTTRMHGVSRTSRAMLHGAARVALACAIFWAGEATSAPNKLPTVSISSPTNGATFTAPASIVISANATDADGSVARVEFYQGSTLIGTSNTSPYKITWSNVAGGAYSLTAKAVDNTGGVKTSSSVAITVTGPKATVTSPPAGSVVYSNSVTVTGSFYGDANTTVLVDNGVTSRVAAISANTFTATLPVRIGPNTLRVTVTRRDKSFDQVSASVTGNTPPLLVFTAPAATTYDAPAEIPFIVDALSPAGSIAKVEFLKGGVLLGAATTPPYQYTWSNVAPGAYVITARVTDGAGVVSTTTLPITVNGTNAPPVVALTSPAAGTSFVAPASIALSANASDPDGAVARVEFLQNGNVIGSTNVTPYSMTWSNVAPGTYAIATRATDNRGATSTSSSVNIVVTPPNVAPAVALISPAAGAQYTAPAWISLAANAADSDGTIARVDFYQGGTAIGSVVSAPYTYAWSNVPTGSYSLTARAIDDRGAVSTSSPVSVVVNARPPNVPPNVTLTAPTQGASYYEPTNIMLTADAYDSDGTVVRVDFYQGAMLIGSSTTRPYAFSWSNVPAGNYVVTARAFDDAGASTTSNSASVSVGALSIDVASPIDGGTVVGDLLTVSGRIHAPANSGVTVNGEVAAVAADGAFYATSVRLSTGANAIVAQVRTPAGDSRSRTLAVTSSGTAPVRVSASPTQGVAPLAVTFNVAPRSEITIARVDFDGNDDGTIEYSLQAPPWATTLTYTGSGTSLTSVRVTDTDGNVYTTRIPVVVYSEAALDQTSRQVWTGLKSALSAPDIPRSAQYLSRPLLSRYAAAFDTLTPYFSQIVASVSDLQLVSISGDIGEYAINRIINGENRIFLLYFGRDPDGVWRLQSM